MEPVGVEGCTTQQVVLDEGEGGGRRRLGDRASRVQRRHLPRLEGVALGGLDRAGGGVQSLGEGEDLRGRAGHAQAADPVVPGGEQLHPAPTLRGQMGRHLLLGLYPAEQLGETMMELFSGQSGRPARGGGIHEAHLMRSQMPGAAQDAIEPGGGELSALQSGQGERQLGEGDVGVTEDAIRDGAGAAQGERHGQQLRLGGVLVVVLALRVMERRGQSREARGETPALLNRGSMDGLQMRREDGCGGTGHRGCIGRGAPCLAGGRSDGSGACRTG